MLKCSNGTLSPLDEELLRDIEYLSSNNLPI